MDTMIFKSYLFRTGLKMYCLCCNRLVRYVPVDIVSNYIFSAFPLRVGATLVIDGHWQHRLVTTTFVQSYIFCSRIHNLIIMVLGNFPHKRSHVVLDAGLIMANQWKWAVLIFVLHCCASISVQGAHSFAWCCDSGNSIERVHAQSHLTIETKQSLITNLFAMLFIIVLSYSRAVLGTVVLQW